jgi:LysR family glycine cleavage system transcriptional activator
VSKQGDSRALPLSALRAFEAAARHLSFAMAAAELGVTPAAVSHQVRHLERKLGVELFVRLNRAVKLTKAGQELAGPLTDAFANMVRLLIRISERTVDRLEVSAMPSFAARWLTPRLARFTVQYPDCAVRLVGEDRLVDFRTDQETDIGIRYGSGVYRGLHVERLTDAEAFPVVSPDFARSNKAALRAPSSLLRLQLLHDETSRIAPGLPHWSGWLHAAGVAHGSLPPGLVFDSAQFAIEAALAGHGVALALRPLVNDDIRSGRLVRPFDLALANPFAFWLVCKRSRERDRRIGSFRRWLHGELQSCGLSSAADLEELS